MNVIKFPQAQRQGYRMITHLHSRASDGKASPLYPVVTRAIRRAVGDRTEFVKWQECLIPAETIKDILEEKLFEIDLVCLTDHESLRSHKLLEENIELARQHSNMILGAEISTVASLDGKDKWITATDILIYGPKRMRQDNRGSWYGLKQKDLDDLYDECVPDGAPEAEVNRVIDFVEKRNYAWAIAHPLDGNALPLDVLLNLLCRARAVEILNGGFPTSSYRAMSAYLKLHNDFVSDPNGHTGPSNFKLSSIEREIMIVLDSGKPHRITPLGGSDAHLKNFDRAVTWMLPKTDVAPRPAAELFLCSLLEEYGKLARFIPEGQGSSWIDLYFESGRIALQNIWDNREVMRGSISRSIYIAFDTIMERLTTYKGYNDGRMNSLRSLGDKRKTLLTEKFSKKLTGRRMFASKSESR